MFGTFYLFNALLFYAGWLTCVLSAAKDLAYVAPLATLVFGMIHFYFSPCYKTDLFDLILMVGLGFGVETVLTKYPILIYKTPDMILLGSIPLWILCIYALFSFTINHTLAFMEGRYLVALILGAVGGTASYTAGVKLGAAEFFDPAQGPYLIAGVWGAAMPIYFFLKRLIKQTK